MLKNQFNNCKTIEVNITLVLHIIFNKKGDPVEVAFFVKEILLNVF